MPTPQETAKRIKSECTKQGLTVKKLLEDCQLGANTIGKMSKGQGVTSQTLSKIADRLGVSIDYLMGREEPHFPFRMGSDGRAGSVQSGMPKHLKSKPVFVEDSKSKFRLEGAKILDKPIKTIIAPSQAAESEDANRVFEQFVASVDELSTEQLLEALRRTTEALQEHQAHQEK